MITITIMAHTHTNSWLKAAGNGTAAAVHTQLTCTYLGILAG